MSRATIRIISGSPTEAEKLINDLYEHYHPLTINIQPMDGKPLVTAIMLIRAEIQRAQLLMAAPGMGRPI